MKPRFLSFVSFFLLSIVFITACNHTITVTSSPESPPLKVTYTLWPGYFPVTVAQEKGLLAAGGVKVELAYSENYLQSISDFSAGKYDGITMSLGSLMSIIEKNSEVQIVLVTDQSAGSDVVVVQPNIQRVADLKGKRVGVKLGDFAELFVTKMLERNNLTSDDVTLVNVEAEMVPARIKSGDIQAGQTWSPYTSEALKAGAKVIFSSEQTPGLIPQVLVFRSDVLRDRPKEIQAFIRAWFQAQDYWKANPAETNALIAKMLNIKPTEVSTDGIQLSGLQDNLKAFTSGTTEESLYHTAKLYADFYIRRGSLSAVPDINKIINPSFIQELQQVN